MHKIWNTARVTLSIGGLLAILIATASVSAQADATPESDSPVVFGVRPADGDDLAPFRLEIDAGAQAQSTLIVSNAGNAALELRSFAVDIETRINGGYDVVPDGSAPLEEAAWMSIDGAPYLLEPYQERALELSVSVPAGTPPGEYMAAVATETTQSSPIEGTTTFRQISRKVNAIVITIPGPTQAAFELGEPSLESVDGGVTLIVPVRNTGNVRVKPVGTITIFDADGDPVASIDIAMDSVYARDSTVIQVSITSPLAAGDYTLSANLTDQPTGARATLSNVQTTIESENQAG